MLALLPRSYWIPPRAGLWVSKVYENIEDRLNGDSWMVVLKFSGDEIMWTMHGVIEIDFGLA